MPYMYRSRDYRFSWEKRVTYTHLILTRSLTELSAGEMLSKNTLQNTSL